MGTYLEKSNAGRANSPTFRVYAPVEGVVVGIHYPSDKTNLSKREIEYDVDPTSVPGMGRIHNAPRGQMSSGYEDGDQSPLRAASLCVSGGSFNKDGGSERPTPRYATDGDRVLVLFVNGNVHRPIIVAVLAHAAATPHVDARGKDLPKDSKLFRYWRHKGTDCLVNERGDVLVDLAEHPDEDGGIKDKKKLEVKFGGFTLTLDATGDKPEMRVESGTVHLLLSEKTFNVKVSGAATIECENATVTANSNATVTGKSGVKIDASNPGSSVVVNVGSGGSVKLGGEDAAMAVALMGDTAGPYPLVCKGMVVKGKVGP